MNPEVDTECKKAFQEFLRTQPIDLKPDSSVYEIAMVFFRVGFIKGGELGARMLESGIREDLKKITGD